MANALGIEITQSSVRGAYVRTSPRRSEPLRYLEVPIAQLGEEGSRQTAVRGALRELLEALGESPDGIYASIAGQHISLRSVTIPEAAAKRASDVLPFELESTLPFSAEEAVIAHQTVRVRDGELTLMAAAAPRDVIEGELAAWRELEVDPRDLTPGAASLDALSTDGAESGEAWLIAHVEPDYTDLCVMRDGRCELARTLDEGLTDATDSPATLRMSLVQTVSMYRAEGGPALSRLVVSGAGGERASFIEWLGGLLDLPTEAVSLPAPEGGSAGAPAFGKAYSLAARSGRRERRLNMRQGEFAAESGAGFVRQHAGLLAACAAALLLAYVYSVWAEYSVLAEERDQLAEELYARTEKHLGEGTRSVRRARELLDRVDKLDDPLPTFDALRALGVMNEAIASDITHDTRRLEIQLDDGGGEGNFELSGSVPDLASRDRIASTLEEHECIGEVEKGRTSSLPGKDVKTYTLEGTLLCNGESQKEDTKGRRRRGGKG